VNRIWQDPISDIIPYITDYISNIKALKSMFIHNTHLLD